MSPKFSKQRIERSRRRSLLVLGAVLVFLWLALLHPVLLRFRLLVQDFHSLLAVGAFFVANTAKPVATVTSGALEQHQVLASHVESTLTTGETVPIPDQQDARRISPQRSTLASDSTKDEYFDLNRFTHDFYEYEQGQKSITVRNRLKDNISFWRTIGASGFILDVIGNGYKLPLIKTPSITFCCNNRSAISNADFVSEAIQDLLDRALIEICNYSPLVVNPLTVSVQHCGKKRLILDLRVVNKHLWKQKVKFEDIRIALSYLEKGFYQIKFDLTSAYHFIEIYKPHTEFLGFSWPDKSGNIIYYKFLVLPFGISTACYLFTKLMRPLINKWRGEGKLVTMFLDDGYGCAKDFENTALLSQEVKSDLLLSGFIPNFSKCIWVPVQLLEFLGILLDSMHNRIYIPDRRVEKVLSTIENIFSSLKGH